MICNAIISCCRGFQVNSKAHFMVYLPWFTQYLNLELKLWCLKHAGSGIETILYDVAGQSLPLKAAQPASQPLWAGESNDKIRAFGLIQNNSGLFIIPCTFSVIEITWQTLQETTCQSLSQRHNSNSQTRALQDAHILMDLCAS